MPVFNVMEWDTENNTVKIRNIKTDAKTVILFIIIPMNVKEFMKIRSDKENFTIKK